MRALVVLWCGLSAASATQRGELIERTLAIVGGQVVTLSEVRTAQAIGLLTPVTASDSVTAAAAAMVDRVLVLREMQRYTPPEPAPAAVDDRLRAAIERYGNSDELKRLLAAGGFTDAWLRAWVRDDLRIAAYLDQRFTATGAVTDDEVSKYFSLRRDEFARAGQTFADVAPQIREKLAADRRAELITDWLAELRRRTPVVELYKRP